MLGARVQERNGGLVFIKYRVSILQDEKSYDMDAAHIYVVAQKYELHTKKEFSVVNLMCTGRGGLKCKASACNAGDPSSIPGSGRSPGEGNGTPLQYFCL